MWITCMKKKAKIKSNSIQSVKMVTCMQKRAKIKLNSERHRGHLQAEEGEDQVQLIKEHMVITCMQKKVEIKFNTIQNAREITCIQKRVNIKTNSMQEAMVACRGKGKGWNSGVHAALSLFLH